MGNRKLQHFAGGLVLALIIGFFMIGMTSEVHAETVAGNVAAVVQEASPEVFADEETEEGVLLQDGDNAAGTADTDTSMATEYVLQNGKLVNAATGVAFSGTGFAKVGDVYYYVVNGTWASSNTDITKVENVEGAKGEWWYVKGGIADFKTNSVEKNANGWWYLKNGKVDFTYSGVARNANGWWRIENGKVNFNFTGFAQNENGWWYLTGGKVRFDKYDVIKGTVNGKSGWWYVQGSKVMLDSTTVAKNANGWWYIKSGKVDFTYSGVAHNANGWWRIENGKVNFNFTGFAQNENGWWYLTGGKVRFDKYDVIKGTVNGKSGWWYVVKSQVKFTNTVAKNANGWWCIENGKVNFNCNSIDKNANGWWKIKNGKVDFSFTGLAQNANGWWYCKGGKVRFDFTGVVKGTVNGEYGSWYVRKGQVISSYDGTDVACPSQNGALHVEGTHLVDESGNVVQLRGVSTHGLAWYSQYVNENLFVELRQDWNANVVRLAMYTADYNGYCTGGDQATLKELIRKGVDYATKADMYVIVDWHILSDGNPNTYKSQAKAFFSEMSKEFANKENVIYEICNEPNGGTTWSQIKSYAEEVIPVIRKNAPNAVILVGTPNWSQYLLDAAADPITDADNIMYTLHFYAATHKEDLRNTMKSAVAKGLPVFVSEYGVCDASGSGSLDLDSANTWVETMDDLQISYVCWSLSNKNESASILSSSCSKTSGFSDSDLSKAGQWLLQVLKNGSTSSGSTASLGTSTSSSAGTSTGSSGTTSSSQNVVTSGNFSFTYECTGSWESGGKTFYQYTGSVKNNGKSAVSSWSVTIPFAGTISLQSGWNGSYTVSGSSLIIKNASYNGSLAAGASTSDIGFIVSGSKIK